MSSYKGRDVYATISSSRTQVESHIQSLDTQIAETERTISRQNAVREDTLVKLADLFLSERAGFATQFADINGRVQAIFDEKTRRREAVDAQLQALANAEMGIQARVAASQQEIDVTEKVIAGLRAKTDADLKTLPEYVTLVAKMAALRPIIEKDAARLTALIAETTAKTTTYLADPFFAYLSRLKHGTLDYKAGWFKRGDDWLARVTGYANNAAQFAILQQIPSRVKEANEIRGKTFAAKVAACDSLIKLAESKNGLPGARETLKGAKTTKDSRLAQLTANQSSQAVMRKEKAAIDSGADPFLKRAKDELKGFFGSQDVATLRRRAAATATDRDDKLVDVLEKAEAIVNTQRKTAKGLIAERTEWEDKLRRAKALEARFSREDYDSSNARFDTGLDTNSLVIGYLAGSYSEHQVFNTFESHHSVYSPPSSYSSPSYSSSSDSSYSSSSSSYDSGSSSSGGDFGGGSFDSGGGF